MAPLRGFQLRSPSRAALEELERLVAIRSDVLTAGFDCHVIGSIILQRVKGMEALDYVASDEQTVLDLEVLATLRLKLHDDNIENNVEGHAWPKSSAEYHLHWGGVLDGVISKMFAALIASAAVGGTTDNLSVVERLARLAVRWQGPSLEHVLDHKLRTLASSTYPVCFRQP